MDSGWQRSREVRLTLVGVFIGLFLAALDQTVIATALPEILRQLGGTAWYGWVNALYLLGSTLAAPVAGRLVEIAPRRAVLLGALLLFAIGSTLCGMSINFAQLLAFRLLQGIGGGALFSLTFTTLAWFFPPRERSKWAGMVGALFGIASAIGPVLGGYLAEHWSWRWTFWINLPFLAAALIFVARYMPHQAAPERAPLDKPGILLLASWTVPLLLAFSCWGPERIAPPALGAGLLGIATIALYFWVRIEKRQHAPLFDLSLLRLKTFRYAALAAFFFGPLFLGGVTFFPLYLQGVLGYSPAESGLLLLAFTVGGVLSTGISGAWVSRHGRYKPLLAGSALLLTALLGFAALSLPHTLSLLPLIGAMVGGAALIGPFQALLSVVGQNDAPLARIGSATSALQFMRQVGSTMGLALLNGLFLVGGGHGDALLRGIRWVFGGSTLLGMSLLLTLLALPDRRLRKQHSPSAE